MVHFIGRDNNSVIVEDDRFPGKQFWVKPEAVTGLLSGELKIERKQ